jgi:iron-sulfur cluster repair protein YtfE (RIC family)
MSLDKYLKMAQDMSNMIEMHHMNEENYLFPILAKKMPKFGKEHLEQHELMLGGLKKWMKYVSKCAEGDTAFSPIEMRKLMDEFKDALFNHLEDEVLSLSGKSMRKHWTEKEMLTAFPF